MKSYDSSGICVAVKLAPQFTKVLVTQVTGHSRLHDPKDISSYNNDIDLGINLIGVIRQTKFKDFKNAKCYIEKLRNKFLEMTKTKNIKGFHYDLEDIEPVFLKGKLGDKYEILQAQILRNEKSYQSSCSNPNLWEFLENGDNGMVKTDFNRLEIELEAALAADLETELRDNKFDQH